MLKQSFVYSDPTRETVTISVDDLSLIESFLKEVMERIKSCAFNQKVEECRTYCNLYLDIENEYNLITDVRLERLSKLEDTVKDETPEVADDDTLRQDEI